MRLRIIAPNGTTSELVVTAAVVRDPACEVPFDAAVYPKVSAEHAKIERTAGGLVLTHLSRSNKTFLNGKPVEGSVPLKAGDLAQEVLVVLVRELPSFERRRQGSFRA